MTAPLPDRGPASTEVLLIQRARRRRERARQRRQGAAAAAAVVVVLALAGGAAALGSGSGSGSGGGEEVAAGGGTETTEVERISSTTEASTAPSSTVTVTTTTEAGDPPECTTAGWPIEQRSAMLVFATLHRGELDQAIADGLGGVFIPKETIGMVGDQTLATKLDAVDRPPLAAVDEEGGRVQRLKAIIVPIPSARAMHDSGPAAIEQLAADHGRKMRALGITVDFAPVVDLVEDDQVEGSGGIGDRSFSADAAETTADAGAFAAGLSEAGILPTYKHFPGHGHSSTDTHDGLGTTPSIDRLRTNDLLPFVQLLGDGQPPAAVMVGHLAVPGLTNGEPASVSKAAITDLLRGELGFDGLVVTDDLGGMKGITDRYTTVEAAVRAVGAGVDMVLVPYTDSAAVVEQIGAAVANGQIPDAQVTASADRVLRAQQPGACPED